MNEQDKELNGTGEHVAVCPHCGSQRFEFSKNGKTSKAADGQAVTPARYRCLNCRRFFWHNRIEMSAADYLKSLKTRNIRPGITHTHKDKE